MSSSVQRQGDDQGDPPKGGSKFLGPKDNDLLRSRFKKSLSIKMPVGEQLESPDLGLGGFLEKQHGRARALWPHVT